MPGEGLAAVAVRDGKVEYIVKGRVHALVGHRPSPCRLVVGPCDLISEKERGKADPKEEGRGTPGNRI